MPKIAELNKLLSFMAYRIFKPLVVLFLRNAIPYQTASDWLKRIYIDTAFENKEFRIKPDKKQSKTRVSILTGLSRVEIDRVLKIEKPLDATKQKWNRATKVLSGWSNDSHYLNDDKTVKKLPIYGDVSFSSLVENYSGGATMRSVLNELIKVGSVKVNSNDVVELVRQDYSIEPNKEKLLNLEISGMSTGELLNTLVHNDAEVEAQKKRYQKIVLGWHIPESNVEEVKTFINSEADKLLIKIDNKLSKLNTDSNDKNTFMVGLGAYYFEGENHEQT